jgi:hypothetical protein
VITKEPTNEQRRRRIMRRVRELEDAAISYARKGGCDPEDWPEIDSLYVSARERLVRELEFLKS